MGRGWVEAGSEGARRSSTEAQFDRDVRQTLRRHVGHRWDATVHGTTGPLPTQK